MLKKIFGAKVAYQLSLFLKPPLPQILGGSIDPPPQLEKLVCPVLGGSIVIFVWEKAAMSTFINMHATCEGATCGFFFCLAMVILQIPHSLHA